MKHITIIQNTDDILTLKEKTSTWIENNRFNIKEIIDIEYSNTETMYMVTIYIYRNLIFSQL